MKFSGFLAARIIALFVFAATTLWLTFGVGDVFPSPDEAANARFAETVATTSTLCIQDDEALLAGGLVHPRSTAVVGDCVVPGSFLGFPVLAGMMQTWFGVWGARLLTPMLAVLAIVMFWDVLRRLTRDELVADVSSLLLMSAPPFWYYAARVMMHNIAFVSLLIFSAWMFFVTYKQRSLLGFFFSGVAAGLAIIVRAFEAPWVLALAVVAFVVTKTYREKYCVAAWIAGCALPLVFLALLHLGVYGHPLATGYTVKAEATEAAPSLVAAVVQDEAWYEMLLPFGFDLKGILRNGFYYGFLLYPWIAVPAVAGIGFALRRRGVAWCVAGDRLWQLDVCRQS
ncbi:MAG: hypothetical protein UY72_C0025G0003 [Candidatus Uhrbacteria bacterium GW2011_GWD2_52_7]|uniref:Glycosyltransferase RgtA/B/C/D-like domain-containing protein n=1 Tax=Candidatus Uhrbacteria bacterium GW2011_GWD2_52_7 TaxID=1618989 RepID=A0A0G1ZPF3_9BACT|nr:MAG: hypothetical protein UY72_C0025G0003 [Candidatus Uhrbacteria bacterium GW2011_GWD2_52_7]